MRAIWQRFRVHRVHSPYVPWRQSKFGSATDWSGIDVKCWGLAARRKVIERDCLASGDRSGQGLPRA
jgi:hypothetical protein